MFIFFIVALTKIYKSRDGLAAVSSNTSIMSEVSNISKSSLPTSISNTQLARQASVGSSTTTSSSVKQLQIKQQQQQQTPLLIQSKQLLQEQQQKNLISNSATKFIQSTPQVKQQLSSSSRTHLGTYAMSNHALNTENARKTLINPNENVSSSSSSINNKTNKKQTGSINNVLSVNTINGNQTTVSSTNSSPSSTSSLNKMNKNELKLNKEIKRLEALCESRTKELSMLKLTLKDLLIKFDGISVAFKYLSCDVSL
jgi:hypothetical protein